MGYRRIRLGQIGNSQTVNFAVQELVTYLKKMDSMLSVDVLRTETIEEEFRNIIWVGIDAKLADKVPQVEDSFLDDAIAVQVEAGNGYITGVNERSVLLAAYRFLKELGCDWVRPGQDGERIPKKSIEKEKINVVVCETPSYRYRCVVIEGANTYENVRDMIDYLPKVGMNTYNIQFFVPEIFFERWYLHEENPYIDREEISEKEIIAMTTQLEYEVAKRQLYYRKVAHGWTMKAFDIDFDGWNTCDDSDLSDEQRSYMAMIDGKRGYHLNTPLFTQMCYSNPVVRGKIIDTVIQYCKENPHIKLLGFSLSDGVNNHCECEECSKKRPSDWYVMLMNELDERMTEEHIDTRLTFGIYQDTLWAPVEERIKNPQRFLLVFCPFNRIYGESFSDMTIPDIELQPYVRNKLWMPDTMEETVAYLRQWKDNFDGESIVFDYHMMWAHLNDLGYEVCARNLYDDIRGFDKLGVNGMFNCQVNRSFFPSALPFNIMAATLWNKDCDYEEKVMSYYQSAFGKDGEQVHDYLKTISDLMMIYHNAGYMNRSYVKPPFCKDYEKLRRVALDFKSVIEQHIQKEKEETRREWELLFVHQQYVILLAEIMELSEQNKGDAMKEKLAIFLEFLNRNEVQTQKVLDSWNASDHWKRFV